MDPHSDPDWLWIEKIREGDTSAFSPIFQKHKINVINLAFRFTKSREAAEDIAQDVFIKVYEGKAPIDSKSKFSTWLYRVTVNAAIDYIRRKKLTPFSLDTREDFADHRQRAVSEVLKEEEIKAIVQNAIDRLPENLRSPILLYQFEELSYREIARILGITEKAVERKLYRAKEILREKLGGILGVPSV